MAQLVWERLGNVPNFVEPFAGSLAVLLARPHAPGTETVNDADALLANFWRALRADPEAVAEYADYPVSELDLTARHLWLVNEGRNRVERLKIDPDYYDAKAAGWWVWGICQWIGSGWCSGKGPHRLPEPDVGEGSGELRGDSAQLPHLGDAGTGVHRKLPHLGNAGRCMPRPALGGVAHQLPHLGDGGRGGHRARVVGVERKRPHLMTTGKDPFAGGVSRQLPNTNLQGVRSARVGSTCAERRAGLIEMFAALADRLRLVRICCGDWKRVTGPSVTFKHGMTGVFLDPPYAHSERHDELYTTETDCAAEVREWCLEHGDNPLLRIALCGYEVPGYEMPETWERVAWKSSGGYGSQGNGRGRDNAAREVIWFSPACLRPVASPQGAFDL